MRVTPRLRRDEGGAVLVIVALSLVVLLGMLALVVDLGRAVAIRRAMVNASDSAALAAAQKCAQGLGSGQAQAAATVTAKMNDGSAILVSFDPGPECDSLQALGLKLVTVRYTTTVDYFVAPILGIDSQAVTTQATAQWGPVASARPVPFVAQQGAFQGPCEIPNVAPGVKCPLWFDNDDFGSSTFGTLNLNMWDVPLGTNCSNKEEGANTHYADVGGYDGQVPLHPVNYPAPTWVCAGTGDAQGIFLVLNEHQIGKILAFPVTDGCTRQGGHCDLFNVVGFARLQFDGVFKKNEAPPECGTPPSNASSHCMLTTWVGGGFGDGGVIGGLDYGLRTIRLVK